MVKANLPSTWQAIVRLETPFELRDLSWVRTNGIGALLTYLRRFLKLKPKSVALVRKLMQIEQRQKGERLKRRG